MEYNNFTAFELNDMASTFAAIRNKVAENSDLFRIAHDINCEICIEYISPTTEFHFTICNPKLKNRKMMYELNYRPANQKSNSTINTIVDSTDAGLFRNLKAWMHLVRNIHEVKKKIHPSDAVLGHYKEQIFKYFSFLKEEEDDQPLSQVKQEQLSAFLIVIAQTVEDEEDIDNSIIKELKFLNENISTFTQAQIKNQISWIFAKIMFMGVGAINKVTRIGYEAGIAHLFIEGIKKYLGAS